MRSDDQVVPTAMGNLLPTLATGSWLPQSSTKASPAFVAVSVPLHVADGWSYLARGLTAHLQGDYATALHLGYYAELRAAIALLGRFGVGVGNDSHVVFQPTGAPAHIKDISTHQFVWEALEVWSQGPEARSLLERAISVEGVKLSDWLTAFNPGATFAPGASRWLLEWGLDLAQFAQDRRLRNAVSYQPTGLAQVETLSVEDSFAFVRALWRAIEPRPALFDLLDRHLLQTALRTVAKPFVRQRGWFDEHLAKAAFDVLGDRLVRQRVIDSMRRSPDPDLTRLLLLASRRRGTDTSVLVRATLLLRIATAASSELMSAAAVTREVTKFWWQAWGTERGFWDSTDVPVEPLDLWVDIADALEAVSDWVTSQVPATRSEFRGGWSPELQILGGADRVNVWSLPS